MADPVVIHMNCHLLVAANQYIGIRTEVVFL